VTRSAKPSTKPSKAAPKTSAFVERLAKDPVSAVLALLEGADEALNATAIKRRLTERGADKAAAEKAWRAAQEKVRFDDHVVFAANTYRWTTTARVISPEEAVYRLSRTTDGATRTKLLAVIQSALEGGASDPPELAEARTRIADAEQRIGMLEKEIARLSTAQPAADDTPHEQYERAERRRAARERQARIDAMSTVAELAAEVEELTAKRATPDVLLEHTRALTGGRGLEAIGRAGESIPYDESRHDPVGEFPDDGESVTVIRPGYLWHAPGEAVLISKALVTRA
jgi:hypothetical protein